MLGHALVCEIKLMCLCQYTSGVVHKLSSNFIESKKVRQFIIEKFKGGSVEKRFIKKPHSTANLNFLFLSLFVYLLKNCSPLFFK